MSFSGNILSFILFFSEVQLFTNIKKRFEGNNIHCQPSNPSNFYVLFLIVISILPL